MEASEFRTALAAERDTALRTVAELERVIAGVVAATAGANTDDEHDPEGATIAFERAQAGAVLDQQRRRLRDVDAALARLDDGSWGRCEVCGEPIAPGRLEVRPTATTCVRCAGGRTMRR